MLLSVNVECICCPEKKRVEICISKWCSFCQLYRESSSSDYNEEITTISEDFLSVSKNLTFTVYCTVHPTVTVQFCTRKDRVIIGLPNFNILYLSYTHAGFQNMARNC